MKKVRIWMALVLCMTLVMSVAGAEEYLKARIEGNTLKVSWNADSAGDCCVLTVYHNNWPISVNNVNGANGCANISIGEASGSYSVRLKTDTGCLTASASVEEAKPDPTKTAQATPEPTVKVTATPAVTPEPTVEVTATPVITPEPTVEVAATPVITPEPTVEVTATPVVTPEPTVEVTATPVITPEPTVEVTATPVVTARPTATPTAKPTQDSGANQSSLAAQVVEQVNAERAKYGLSALRVDAELTRAANVRAQEIVESFSHTRPDGSQWSTVSDSAYGENIAKGQNTVDRVMASWMSSEGHRANILRESYGSIGVSAYVVNGITYWVQLFGK